MKKSYKLDMIFSIICISASIFLFILSKAVSGFSNASTRYILPVYINTVGRFMSKFPLSVFELLIYVAAVFLILGAFYTLNNLIKKNMERVRSFLWKTSSIICALVLMMTMTTLVNYNRDSIADTLSLDVEMYTRDELFNLTKLLIARTNELAEEVYSDNELHRLKRSEVVNECIISMQNLGEIHPVFSGFYSKPKAFLLSKAMSHLSITGMFSPFTLEPNYSTDVAEYIIPFTICHELAHSRGFMKEEDANFIAYLATRSSQSPFVRLSAEMNALAHVLNAYSQTGDSDGYRDLYYSINARVLQEFREDNEHWLKYDTPVARAATAANDLYLKSNSQSEGVESYGLVVNLIYSLYRAELEY